MSDGRDYRTTEFSGPIYSHSNACAVGSALALATRQAYTYEQTYGRVLGQQTYRMHLDAPSIYASVGDTFKSTTWVDVARWKAFLPTHANRVSFEFHFRLIAWIGARVLARVTVYDGVSTATGDFGFMDFEPAAVDANALGGSAQGRAEANRVLYDRLNAEWGGWNLGHVNGSVDVSSLNLGQRNTITVQAYCVDSETELTQLRMHPDDVIAWWDVVNG